MAEPCRGLVLLSGIAPRPQWPHPGAVTLEEVTLRTRLVIGLATPMLAFLLLSRWVMSGGSLGFDLSVRNAVHALEFPLLTRVMMIVTTLGSLAFILPLAVILAWQLAARGHRNLALMLPIILLSAELASQLLKLLFHRPRPEVFFGLAPVDTFSFPSGHAFTATVFYGMIAAIFISAGISPRRRAAIALGTLSASLFIGLSRVYLGYHYPTDVLGGWACAVAWLALSQFALAGTAENEAAEPQQEHQ